MRSKFTPKKPKRRSTIDNGRECSPASIKNTETFQPSIYLTDAHGKAGKPRFEIESCPFSKLIKSSKVSTQ